MTLMMGLTKRQAQCHRFIFEYLRHNGRAPNLSDICEEMSLKHRGAAHHLITRLVERGCISHDPHRSRSIRIIQNPPLPNKKFFKVNPETLKLEEMHNDL